MDIAKRFHQNPLLKPSDLQPGIEGMEITCFLNPGVFRFDGKIWLLLRVAERPVQKQGVISFPVYNKERKIEVLSFDENDPKLDASDPRVIGYAGQNYLTTMSYLRLVASEDGIHFKEEPDYPPIFGQGALEAFGIEDCRVATTADGYYLTFTEVSSVAVGVGLIHTRDWKNYTRHGMIFPPHNKDCALFEETINGKYLAFRTKVERRSSNVQVSVLNDLRHIAEEESHNQCVDVRTIDVGIGHDDNLVITQLFDICFFAVILRSDCYP